MAGLFDILMEDIKILKEIADDYALPEDQLYIHDDEPCPCGSGKEYINCCKGKSDTQQEVSPKPIEVLTMENMRGQLKRFHCCLHPDHANCKGKIKDAHALQNNKILSLLGSVDNHVIIQDHTRKPLILQRDGNPIIIIPFEKVSRNKATTQNCFCDFHDTVVFKPIEGGAPSFDPNNDEMKFIYAYKAFIFEYSKQQFLMNSMRSNFPKKPQFFSQREQVAEYRIQSMRMEEMNPIKDFYDSELLEGTHNGVHTCVVTIPHRIEFAFYSYLGFDYDLNGQRIKSIDQNNRMHRLSVTVIPEVNKSFILLSCMESEEKYYNDFFLQIMNSELDKTLYYFNMMLPLYSENIVLSEKLWEKHGADGQLALTHMANLYGPDQLNLSNVIAMGLRNAAKSKNTDYSKRGKVDLFQNMI